MVTKEHSISVRRQCELLEINRSCIYYVPVGESSENLWIMRKMDEYYLDHPTSGVNTMKDFLLTLGLIVNHKRIRRLLRLMGLMAIYPKKNLSKLGKAKYIKPYLLRDLDIDHVNHVWQIDITYIRMEKGFMYLTAIIDVYSRYIVGWSLSNTLDGSVCTSLLKRCIAIHGKPKIINSDQGSQFTSEGWIDTCVNVGIEISMDGKGRATDNIYIERFWRTIKQELIYLNEYKDGLELYQAIDSWMQFYNADRIHSSVKSTPKLIYYQSQKQIA